MSEMSFEQMLEESFKTIRNGEESKASLSVLSQMRSSLILDISQTELLHVMNIRTKQM